MQTVVSRVLAVFNEIGNWIPEALENMVPIFYSNETGLTFLGTLAVCGLAFSVVFLLIGIIQKFLKFGA